MSSSKRGQRSRVRVADSCQDGKRIAEKSKQMGKAMWKCPKCGRSFSREGQAHYCGKVETVDAYIEAQDEAVRPFLNEIRQILREAIPEAKETISWSMPTYWKNRNLIHFAASGKHLGLYPGDEAVTVFAERLADYKVSKGTIQIPYLSPLPRELIADIARWCCERYGTRRNSPGRRNADGRWTI